jgi:uncharacterized protein
MMMPQLRPDRTRGIRHDVFWDWCSKSELRLQKCGSCSGLQWPVRGSCEFCGHREFNWEHMSGRGTVVSWCSFAQDYYRGALPPPYDCILVELEEGVLFISNPSGFGWADVGPGMPVKVAFVDAQDSGGAFRLPVFERA